MSRSPVHPLTLRQRIWLHLDDPTSSKSAKVTAFVVIGAIILSTAAFVIQTLPQFVFSTDPVWIFIEWATISVFTLEFVLRLACCPSIRKFVTTPLNIIDFVAIMPFYVELLLGDSVSGSSAVVRIFRLIRIFRIFKVSRYLPWVKVFANAMLLSLNPLLMLVFVILIATIVFSSAIYYAERGEWSDTAQAFMRDGNPPTISPYQSIPASMWWCIVTMTTVGYGDVTPITPAGRAIASFAALSGILVLAIPITVISTNFNSEYATLQKQRELVRSRMLLLKSHFKERKTGLEAVLDEIEDLVKRNSQEFQAEVETLFETARAELTEEVQEVVRMAFDRRRALHLAALAAGHMQGSSGLQLGRGGWGGGLPKHNLLPTAEDNTAAAAHSASVVFAKNAAAAAAAADSDRASLYHNASGSISSSGRGRGSSSDDSEGDGDANSEFGHQQQVAHLQQQPPKRVGFRGGADDAAAAADLDQARTPAQESSSSNSSCRAASAAVRESSDAAVSAEASAVSLNDSVWAQQGRIMTSSGADLNRPLGPEAPSTPLSSSSAGSGTSSSAAHAAHSSTRGVSSSSGAASVSISSSRSSSGGPTSTSGGGGISGGPAEDRRSADDTDRRRDGPDSTAAQVARVD